MFSLEVVGNYCCCRRKLLLLLSLEVIVFCCCGKLLFFVVVGSCCFLLPLEVVVVDLLSFIFDMDGFAAVVIFWSVLLLY